jgi:hypothetical protein
LFPSAWDGLALKNNSIALEQALELYNTHLDSALASSVFHDDEFPSYLPLDVGIPVEQDQLDAWHRQYLALARQFLKAKLIGHQDETFWALFEVDSAVCLCVVLRHEF